MDKIELHATTREIVGKKVRFLRRQGITPIHIFGHGIESMALQCDAVQLRHVLSEAGRTQLIDLKIGRARKPRNVVVREIQRNTRTDELLHVDLYQVRMEEEIKVKVPIVLVGESIALKSKGNIMVQELYSLSIECLPDRIPTSIEVDVGCLEQAEQTIQIKDIVLGEEVTVLDDPEHIVVKIGVLRAEMVEEAEAPAEVPEVTKAEGEGEESAGG